MSYLNYTSNKLRSDMGDCVVHQNWGYTSKIKTEVDRVIDEVKTTLDRDYVTCDGDIAHRKALYEKTLKTFSCWLEVHVKRERTKDRVRRYIRTAEELIHNITDFSASEFSEQKHFENILKVAEILQREEMSDD